MTFRRSMEDHKYEFLTDTVNRICSQIINVGGDEESGAELLLGVSFSKLKVESSCGVFVQ